MLYTLYSVFGRLSSHVLWNTRSPVRAELFGLERLEEHAISLAKAQRVSKFGPIVLALHKRLDENAVALLRSYRSSAAELEHGFSVVPAAEWLLDNYHLVEAQIREVRDDLPAGYYRQLPKLADGPLAGYPRIFGLAWAYVAHTDSHIDADILSQFVQAYQSVQPLTIGELWALPITLRVVLIENLRRLADQITQGREQRNDADRLTKQLLVTGCAHTALQADIASRSTKPLSEVFAAQLAKRLRDQDPKTTPALEWLEQRLKAQDLTVSDVVQHAQKRQGASNVSIRNVITSMRFISDLDWETFFEKVSLVDKALCVDSVFSTMDFTTRNLYRSAIEQLARGSKLTEIEIAKQVVETARYSAQNNNKNSDNEQNRETKNQTPTQADQIERERLKDPGYYLIDQGRLGFEASIGYRPTLGLRLRRFHISMGITGYSGAIVVFALGWLSLALLFPQAQSLSNTQWLLWLALGFIPATELTSAIVNRLVTWRFGAMTLPGLELKSGVPAALRTMIAVPTLLTSKADLLEQIERLEVHFLSGIDGDVTFALLTDGVDASQEETEQDVALLALASAEIKRLNIHYHDDTNTQRFFLLHRRRQFNPSENTWMGWERKRGKLRELNRLLRGAKDTSFVSLDGQPLKVPENVRYVMTLDADTRMPRESALRLIGKMAHPLNRPRFDSKKQRVVAGYGILQPRVTPSLSVGYEGSLYQRIFSAPGGIDPYAAAISDVYQDLFGEGSFTGKGIYDVDMFEAALANRVADNTMLSHDLFEGIFARAGLVSDVEVVEEFPARYDVAAKRQHRWTRGDWQLLPWVFGKRAGQTGVTRLGRWKLLDNLRRSLAAPATLLALLFCWTLPLDLAIYTSGLLLASIAIPAFIPSLFSIIPHHSGVDITNHFRLWLGDLRLALSQTFLSVMFLPDQSWRNLDAIARTLTRLWVTHKHCLQWMTAAHCNGSPRLKIFGFYQTMFTGTALGVLVCGLGLWMNPVAWPLIITFLLLWLFAPMVALYVSRAPAVPKPNKLDKNNTTLRLIARRTWRFFETFVTPQDNMLPPDNFQEEPEPVIAHRTSPTNIGLYLLSAGAAHDFGWAGLLETIERLETTFVTLDKMSKYKGHFFNWYSTETLTGLLPKYISSVDSGNLAGHLIALANSCDEWAQVTEPSENRQGVLDNLSMMRAAIQWQAASAVVMKGQKKQPIKKNAAPTSPISQHQAQHLLSLVDEMVSHLNSQQTLQALLPILIRLMDKAAQIMGELSATEYHNVQPLEAESVSLIKRSWHTTHPRTQHDHVSDLIFWTHATQRLLQEQQRDRLAYKDSPQQIIERLAVISMGARSMACAMDFAFLIDDERKLLSIGYALSENCLDPSCYDLLASEARLASLFAIAKGDVATKHWFRLGRTATPVGNGSALISWSGSMFEYLMPSLVMRAPAGSLLEQTNRLIVQRQQDYGRHLGIPWGVSESAYNARDYEFTYQYSNFGVPGLGLQRGLAENKVIAPYATGLATMVDPKGALKNFLTLTELGANGRFGFYEALDFTPSRVPFESDVAIVRNFMAHHQGMTIVGIFNALHDGLLRRRFHREPMIQACELLLQERTPRNVSISHPRAEEVKVSASISNASSPTVRHLSPLADGAPVTHLLSNGRYAVMLTGTGAGYSRWRDIAITRWQEDTTCDPYGSFVFIRDTQTGQVWSASAQPLGTEGRYLSGVFEEDHAQFIRHNSTLTTMTDVLVSGEDDGEVRRVSLSNNGRSARDIELTSYMELVLTSAQADNAHPAFAKMFVQTEYVPEYGALVATRRKRSPDEPSIWAAHFAIVEGAITADPQYETSRALFIGVGNAIDTAAAFERTESKSDHTTGTSNGAQSPLLMSALSNTVGTVLDPIFSLRYCVNVPAGGVVRVSFWTVVASTREELFDLIDRHHDRSAYDRAKTLSWTQAQVQLRHLDISSAEAADFQRLAAPILYADARFRPSPETICRGMGSQSELWPLAIGGDLPIVLLRIDDIEDIKQVKQLLRAHEYWRLKRLGVDLVIVNEHASSYRQELQIAIETLVRSSQSRPRLAEIDDGEQVKGTVHMLRADLMTAKGRDLLNAVARVVLIARHGSIGKQLDRLPPAPIWRRNPGSGPRSTANVPLAVKAETASSQRAVDQLKQNLEFFNGWGGFSDQGREYTVILNNGVSTPAPWINVIANSHFGFQVAADGGGYTWAQNSRENQLTPWSNDPVSNPSGEAIYVRDEDSLQLYSATAQPLQGTTGQESKGTFIAHHGFGYSRFEHSSDGLALSLVQYVALLDPIKISRLTLHNQSDRHRRFSVTAYIEWVMGTNRGASGPFITTQLDTDTHALMVCNPWSVAFSEQVAFADMGGQQTSWSNNRTEFLGRNGRMNAPASLLNGTLLSGVVVAGLDPCTVQQCVVELAPGQSTEVVMLMGQCASAKKARTLINTYRKLDLNVVLDEVKLHWQNLLGAVQVTTPDRAMDIMLNGWLLYQTVACRMWARSGFYQASGAFGFRDQLQDGMSLTFRRPDLTRKHILRAAGRQFAEGDVQHWWLPHSGQGVRTRISDDRVWLAFAVATYIQTSGDTAILDEIIPFIEGPALADDEHDAYFQPMVSEASATLFEHCARALDQCLSLTGEHGLPLMGTGDWNDGMNRVGQEGKGESVWLGWLFIRTMNVLAPIFIAHVKASAQNTEALARIQGWQDHASAIKQGIETHAWDGQWYRRANFDDGTWLGSKQNEECRIDAIAQSWAVLSGAAQPERAAMAMAAVEQNLIQPEHKLSLLFTPPFDQTTHDPGYIKGYPPGLRENGGQYSHAAMWSILAFTKLGDGQKAFDLFAMLNPINHASNAQDALRYKVEPYVLAADVYSVAPHIGRGGWTWYTGAAGWMYRAGMEGILGINREGKELSIQPCLPPNWPEFEARIKVKSTDYSIHVVQSRSAGNGAINAVLDELMIPVVKGVVRLPLDGRNHKLSITIVLPS